MKNCSVRKIVLSSIGFLASLMLLIGLSFTVIKYDPGLKNELGAAMRQIGLSASGFDMLSFELPATLKAFMLGLFTAEDYSVDFTAFEKISGVISVLTLVTALLGIALTIVSFFCFSKKKSQSVATTFVVLSLVLAFVYAVASVIFVAVVKSDLKEVYKSAANATGTSGTSGSSGTSTSGQAELQAILSGFKTNMFVALILQLIFAVAYLVCVKTIAEKAGNVVCAGVGDGEKCAEGGKKKQNDDIFSVIGAEARVIELLTSYKKLCDEAVISSSDYIDKKISLLRYSGKKLRAELPAIVGKSSYWDTVQAEEAVTAALRGYKQLLDQGIISEGDFADKKAALLNCVVHG